MLVPQVNLRDLATQCRAKFFEAAPEADIVVTTDRRHIGYLAGYRGITHDGVSPYAQGAIATRDCVALVTGASDAAAALEVMEDVAAIWRYGRFYVFAAEGVAGYDDMPEPAPSFEDAVLRCLARWTTNGDTIALDVTRHSVEMAIRTKFGTARFLDAVPGLVEARTVKLPGELDLLRHASRITDKAIEYAVSAIVPNMTELEIAAAIQAHIVANGGVPRFSVVTSGERSSRVDAYASPRRIDLGDTVRLDIGCTVKGYSADMARTVVVGEPTPLQADRYQALLEGEQAQVDLIKPGIRARDLFDVAVATVRRGALPGYQRNHCGHGIGLASHEFPLLDASADVPLVPGMVLCVETPFYELGWGGMMVEDTVIVTETGHELLTTTSRDLVPPHLRGKHS